MLEPGLRATATETVTDEMTADEVGSGDVPVLATPVVLALVEEAAVIAVSGELAEGETTVGSLVELEHLAPTPLGEDVTADATLEEVNGRTLRFAFEVTDGAGLVARGRHERVVVERERFVETARQRG